MQDFYDSDHASFRDTVARFVDRDVQPHLTKWDDDRLIPREFWRKAAAQGLIGLSIPAEYGGAGSTDYRFRCIVNEELARVGAAAVASSVAINEDIVSSYLVRFGSDQQKQKWLPGMADGSTVSSIAMSEPSAGSDLRGIQTRAIQDGDGWVINGSKTFITNGFSSDVVLVAARTGESAGRARLSLILVPADADGFARGRKLRKIGLHAQDTAELYFDDVRVPFENLLGQQDKGFHHLTSQLPLERLSIAWRALVASEAALGWTLAYVKERSAFGTRLIDLQSTRFRLAELTTEIEITRSYLEEQVLALNNHEMDALTGAKAKWWATELQNRVVNACVQLHGGYGYMEEYPIARAFVDARAQTIVGGTTEIMKEIIGRALSTDD